MGECCSSFRNVDPRRQGLVCCPIGVWFYWLGVCYVWNPRNVENFWCNFGMMLLLLTVSQNYMKSHTDSMWSVRTVNADAVAEATV